MLAEALARIGELKKKQEEEIKRLCDELLAQPERWQALFDGLPDYVVGIHWTQYTPHFNDGDPCEFSVYDPCFLVTESRPWMCYQELSAPDDEGIDIEEAGLRKEDGAVYVYDSYWADREKPEFAPFAAVLDSFKGSDDVMEAVFGDHVEVFITRSGVTTVDYSHD